MQVPEGISPADSNIPLWRYMSFSRFNQFVEEQELYFARIDCFSDFSEGAMSAFSAAESRKELSDQGDDGAVANTLQAFVRLTMVNPIYAVCWNASSREANLMWRAYGGIPESATADEQFKIAIKTNPNKLIEALNKKNKDNASKLHMGMVQYLDFEKENTPSNILSRAFTKCLEYQDEKECRLVIFKPENMPTGLLSNAPEMEKGIKLPIDVESLIEEILIEPPSVKDQEKFGISGTKGQDSEYAKALWQEVNRRITLVQDVTKSLNIDPNSLKVSGIL